MSDELWPTLPYDAWKETYATLHMWSQVVGKVVLAQAPPLNHSWGISFDVTPRGLTTRTLPHGDRLFTIAFDFIDHQLVMDTSDGDRRTLALEPRTVAEFYRTVMAMLEEMRLPVRIWPVPVEIPDPIPFGQDTVHHSYDPEAVGRYFRVLLQVHRVFTESRTAFVGKASPSHFFWGSFDLAVTRFSGRSAPPREGPAFMREAYSHEVISHGFWPGSGPILEPSFYAYAVPEPDGLKSAAVRPDAAFYHRDMGEFILPYEAVRKAASPAAEIAAFIESTYDQAATRARWDRAALDRPGSVLPSG